LWLSAIVIAAVYMIAFVHGSTWSTASCKSASTVAAQSDAMSVHTRGDKLRDELGDRDDDADDWTDSIGPATSADTLAPTTSVDATTSVASARAASAAVPTVAAPAAGARAGHAQTAERRVIAYSLYGDRPKYVDGALRNAELVQRVFPGWIARFYVDSRTVPLRVLRGLRARGAEVVEVDTSKVRDQHMFWRFWVAADPTVDRYISRDSDSRLLPRDFAAVSEWIDSGRPFHIVRDHPSHSNYPISGGLWGGTRDAVPQMLQLIEAFPTDSNYLTDMNFLNERVWPLARERSLQHDAFSCDRFGARPFPMARSADGEHVGQVFEEGERPRQADVELLLNAASPLACRHPADAPTRGNARAAAEPTADAERRPGRRGPEALAWCKRAEAKYGIVPGSSWGTASLAMQDRWSDYGCDVALAAVLSG
jgi:hypothetical protein